MVEKINGEVNNINKEEKVKLDRLELFPSFFSDPKRKSLFENGYYNEGNHLFEYAHEKTLETDHYYVCVMDHTERFNDEYGDSTRKIIDVVFRKKDGSKKRHTSTEYWKTFKGKDGRVLSNEPDDILDFAGILEVENTGNDQILITISEHRGKNESKKVNAKFSADLSMGGEIEKI